MTHRLKYGLARRFRKALTPPEVRLWVRLRSRGGGNLVFRRQHPLGPYVLDFYCPAARLAIEVDGFEHTQDEHIARDERRDAWVLSQGVETMRIPAGEVMKDADAVADGIYDRALARVTELQR